MKIDIKKIRKKAIGFISAIAITICSFPASASASELQYWPQGPEVQSSAAIVMELSTGLILYEKNINDVHYPASITKILTTLLALENSTMDEVVTFSKDSVYNTEGSGIARDVGEEMTMEQCLYAIMLASANECAYAVAEHVSGDVNSFVNMMNERCAALGCKNTHFSNCNGLPDEQHYTSAYDMALIAREAYKNEYFHITSTRMRRHFCKIITRCFIPIGQGNISTITVSEERQDIQRLQIPHWSLMRRRMA